MSPNLHVCKICGKKFATFKAVCGHQRIHSSKRNRMEEDDKEIWGICSVSASCNEISNESETFDDLFRIGSSSLSQSFYVCKICGKKFETFKAVCGHQRIHSGKRNRMEENGNEIWGLCSVSPSTNEISSETETLGSSLSLKQSSFLTEIEQNKMNEAAMNIVIFSERLFEFDASRNLPSGDDFMDLELITMKEKKILPCVESKLDFSVLIYHSGSESSSNCSDVAPQALPSPLTRKLQKMTSNSSYDCKKCGEKFATSKAVCGHQRIHSCRSNRVEDEENGLQRIWGLVESRACSIVNSSNEISIETETGCLLQESSFMIEIEKHEMSEAAMNLLMLSKQVYDFAAIRNLSPGDDTMALKLQTMQEKVFCCVESKLHFSELLSHSDFKNASTCSDVVAQGLPYHLQKRPQSSFNYKCRICGKIFGCSKALGGHQTLHRTSKGQLARNKEDTKDTDDDNSISISSEAKKIVSEPSRIEASQKKKKKILHCVESKLNFSELFPHSGFELNKVVSQALLSPLRSGLQEKPQRNSNYNCKICDKSFGCSQALGGHQTLHRTIKGQLARKKEDTEDDNSLSGVTESEAMKFVSQP